MADLGYVDFYEALSIYQYLDPASVQARRAHVRRAAAGDADRAAGGAGRRRSTRPASSARRSARCRPTPTSSGCTASLVLLINKAMAADLVDPGDFEHGKEALGRAVAYLGLGLEYLSRGDATRAGQALGSVALERIFRVGFSLDAAAQDAGRHARHQGRRRSHRARRRRGTTSCAPCRQRRPEYPARPRRRRPPTARATSPRSPTSPAPPRRSNASQNMARATNGNSLRRRDCSALQKRRQTQGVFHSWPTR